MTRRATFIALLAAPASALCQVQLHVDPTVKECEVHFASTLTQQSFRRFAREFGSGSAFKQGAPPATLVPWGVSVGVEYQSIQVEDRTDAWNDTFVHPDATHWLGSTQSFPKLRLRVGVADDTEVGAFFTMNPRSNYGWVGIEAKHALLRQDAQTPVTVAVRGAYTKTLFVHDMDMHALSGGVSVGRTFWDRLTPYLGVGADAVLARETSSAVSLKTETALAPHAFAGLEVSFWRLAMGIEAQLGAVPSAQVQMAAQF